MQANKHNPEESKSINENESTKEVEEKSNHQTHNKERKQQQQVTNSRRPQPKHPYCIKTRKPTIKKMSKNHTTTSSPIGTPKVTPSSKAQSYRIRDWFQATPAICGLQRMKGNILVRFEPTNLRIVYLKNFLRKLKYVYLNS
jgi:hypothetical protein